MPKLSYFSPYWRKQSLCKKHVKKQLILFPEKSQCFPRQNQGKLWDSRETKLTVSWGTSLQETGKMCVQKGGFVISRFFFIYCILLKLGQRKSFVTLRTSLYRGSLYRSSTVAGKCEAGNSLNLAVMTVVSQHSQLTVHCYPLTS